MSSQRVSKCESGDIKNAHMGEEYEQVKTESTYKY